MKDQQKSAEVLVLGFINTEQLLWSIWVLWTESASIWFNKQSNTSYTQNQEKTLRKAKKKTPFPLLTPLVLTFSTNTHRVTEAQLCRAFCALPPQAHTNQPPRPPQKSSPQAGSLCIQVGSRQHNPAFTGCPDGVKHNNFYWNSSLSRIPSWVS